MNISLLVNFLIFSFFAAVIEATLSPRTKETKTKPKKYESGPVEKNVFELNLVNTDTTAKDILKNNQAYFKETSTSRLNVTSLGYITPWNNHGYDVAKIFANKFTHISPVWLQIKRTSQLAYEITGTHDVDDNWMKDVVKAGRQRHVKIIPRLLLEGWSINDFRALFEDSEEVATFSRVLSDACTSLNFKGFVLEGWAQLFNRVKLKHLVDVLKAIATHLAQSKYQTILVLPPKGEDEEYNQYTKTVFEEMYDSVAGFSLMTYDFSSVQRPGPNAPIPWINDTVRFLSPNEDKRKKILTGLNFYGNAYTPNGGDAIIGSRYLELLKKFKGKIPYDPGSAEHYFEVNDGYHRYFVFYPTLYSINERLKLLADLGTGVSIWELGQGLDYFYDLF